MQDEGQHGEEGEDEEDEDLALGDQVPEESGREMSPGAGPRGTPLTLSSCGRPSVPCAVKHVSGDCQVPPWSGDSHHTPRRQAGSLTQAVSTGDPQTMSCKLCDNPNHSQEQEWQPSLSCPAQQCCSNRFRHVWRNLYWAQGTEAASPSGSKWMKTSLPSLGGAQEGRRLQSQGAGPNFPVIRN